MDAELMDRSRAGLEAWMRGQVSALEPMLDPEVELVWWEPGDWDCHGREEVLSLLRERADTDPASAVELIDAGPQMLVVSRTTTVQDGPEAGFKPATAVRFRDGKVVSMRQYRSKRLIAPSHTPGQLGALGSSNETARQLPSSTRHQAGPNSALRPQNRLTAPLDQRSAA